MDSRGSGSYLGSATLNIIERKFSAKLSELSGYTNGIPTLKRWQAAARVGILAIRRTTWRWRTAGSKMSLASA